MTTKTHFRCTVDVYADSEEELVPATLIGTVTVGDPEPQVALRAAVAAAHAVLEAVPLATYRDGV